MESYEEHEVNGLTVKIYQDDDGSFADPRDNDNVGVMLCWHPDYELGDEQFRSPEDVGGSRSMQEVSEWLVKEREAFVMLPLYLLDHSGISISAGAPIQTEGATADDVRSSRRFMGDDAGWDTSMVGFIYTTHKQFDEMSGGDPWELIETEVRGRKEMKPRVIANLLGEVEEYDLFLTGQVFGYVIEGMTTSEGGSDSCWGFLGLENVRGEALATARSIRPTNPADRLEAVGL